MNINLMGTWDSQQLYKAKAGTGYNKNWSYNGRAFNEHYNGHKCHKSYKYHNRHMSHDGYGGHDLYYGHKLYNGHKSINEQDSHNENGHNKIGHGRNRNC